MTNKTTELASELLAVARMNQNDEEVIQHFTTKIREYAESEGVDFGDVAGFAKDKALEGAVAAAEIGGAVAGVAVEQGKKLLGKVAGLFDNKDKNN